MPEGLSERMREALAMGNRILARDYLAALDWPALLNAGLDEVFQRCDAIITPATPGAAPDGLESTGSAIFNATWTLCGTPGHHPAGVRGIEWIADGNPARRSARWRRASAAHGRSGCTATCRPTRLGTMTTRDDA